MAWKSALLVRYFLLLEVSSAAIKQQLLSEDDFDPNFKPSSKLAELCGMLPDRCVYASPIASACYHQASWFNETECAVVESNKTWDIWIASQPGGYYYVGIQYQESRIQATKFV